METAEIYTLSLHDALPISPGLMFQTNPSKAVCQLARWSVALYREVQPPNEPAFFPDRKSTRLNSSHPSISYAVFCLKKKKKLIPDTISLVRLMRMADDIIF